ncbi:MAG: VCBS repeat-containing protein [Saprospiraceae bacterium]|nr:VCBS repeat-containing protein [Saprospiraceae bacterium]
MTFNKVVGMYGSSLEKGNAGGSFSSRCVGNWIVLLSFLTFMVFSNVKLLSQSIDPSVPWKMHIIDNSSFGSDGTKVCDVNKDGLTDIICGWEQGHVARLYFNPGPSEHWSYLEVPARDVEDALVVDLDADGYDDIVTFSEGTHKRITIHWAPKQNYADKSQWLSQDIPCTVGATQWMFGRPMDVDGKNGLDLIVAAKNEGAIVGWLESPSNPRDIDAWKLHTIAPASWVMSIEILDIDFDGQPDVLVSDRNNDTNGIKWFKHPGTQQTDKLHQRWDQHLVGLPKRDPMFFQTARYDHGLLEIWVPDIRNHVFHFKQLDSLGHDWALDSIPFPTGSGTVGKSAAIGDINGDGQNDLVTTYDGARERIGIFWSSHNAVDDHWIHHNVSGLAGNKYDFAYLIDMDLDGDLDILSSEENNNSSTVAGLGVIWYENPLFNK